MSKPKKPARRKRPALASLPKPAEQKLGDASRTCKPGNASSTTCTTRSAVCEDLFARTARDANVRSAASLPISWAASGCSRCFCRSRDPE